MITKSKERDTPVFSQVWNALPNSVVRRVKRVHLDKGYWCENIMEFLRQEGIQAVIPCKSNSIDHGTSSARDTLVRMQKKHPGLYKVNYRPHLRVEVEHIFGEVKLRPAILRARTVANRRKALFSMFLWYNYERAVKKVIAM